MLIMPLLAFLLWFFLFAASGGLAYLSFRTWMRCVVSPNSRSRWHQTHWDHLLRAAGFTFVTIAALSGAVGGNEVGRHVLDVVSLTRIVGDILLFASTPRRLRRQPILGLAFIVLVLGEALMVLNARHVLPDLFYPASGAQPLVLCATLFLNIGIGLIWSRYVRTVLKVRLTDKFTLAFAIFSVFLLLLVTGSIEAVVQTSLYNSFGGDVTAAYVAFQSLNRTLILLFVTIVTLSAILSFFLARSLTEPVSAMGQTLREIGSGSWDKRIRGIRSRDEIQDLAHEINQMARRLKEADELRAEFVSFASHELRNPLTAVKGFIETLQIMDDPGGAGVTWEERREIYGIVQEECVRLLRMTNELLDTSRIEAGKPVTLHLQNCDIVRIANKVSRVMGAHTTIHTLRVHSVNPEVLMDVDPDKLEQILINLLSNAIKYSPNGGDIAIYVSDQGATVDLEVRDQGAGMSQEQTDKVFDKFYRIQDPDKSVKGTKRAAEGTGIGLYLTRALVNAHGGNIRVHSKVGEGSAFTITLPRVKSARYDPPADSNSLYQIADSPRSA